MLEDAVGAENASVAEKALDESPSVSVRLNPSRMDDSMAEEVFGPGLAKVPWSRHGFMLPQRPQFTLDPFFHAGAYYVQDSSAMFVGEVFRTMAGDGPLRVLDLCAAPGGKTTDVLASLRERGGKYLVTANEVMRQRASVLRDNIALWGDPHVVVTSCDPKAFSSLPGFFDIIVADVPCSGEGMFRKDPEARADWSESVVALCESRQRRIIADAWPALKEGGILIYSTCTFNRRENDGNVGWIAENLGAEPLTGEGRAESRDGVLLTRYGHLLLPGLVPGEGQYCAALRKTSSTGTFRSGKSTAKEASEYRSLSSLFTIPMKIRMKGETIIAIPEDNTADMDALSQLKPLAEGVAVGVMKGGKLIPHDDLSHCICLAEDAFPKATLSREEALKFLHRDPVTLGAGTPKGVNLLEYKGMPLGFVKNLGNRTNSLLPQDRRIRMNIE